MKAFLLSLAVLAIGCSRSGDCAPYCYVIRGNGPVVVVQGMCYQGGGKDARASPDRQTFESTSEAVGYVRSTGLRICGSTTDSGGIP